MTTRTDVDPLEGFRWFTIAHPLLLEMKERLSGQQVGVLHTADYFAVYADRAGWVECKTEEDLRHNSPSPVPA